MGKIESIKHRRFYKTLSDGLKVELPDLDNAGQGSDHIGQTSGRYLNVLESILGDEETHSDLKSMICFKK